MPLQIIREDITRMRVDAIVNATNPALRGDGGVDGAIHRAAGPALDAACRALGGCAPGEARITAGFGLPCRHVIHTVGPLWRGGAQGEAETLASCFRAALALAREHGCESVAFPLIASGTFGFPKALALKIAVDEISRFLLDADMLVYIVAYSREDVAVSEKLFSAVAAYIDDQYVDARRAADPRARYREPRNDEAARRYMDWADESAPPREIGPARRFQSPEDAGSARPRAGETPACPPAAAPRSRPDAAPSSRAPAEPPEDRAPKEARGLGRLFGLRKARRVREAPTDQDRAPDATLPESVVLEDAAPQGDRLAPFEAPAPFRATSLDEMLSHMDESFRDMLLRKIDENHMTDPECYNRANIDRRLFNKIKNNPGYRPGKPTVLALAVGLRLSLDETRDLLMKAGYALSHSNKSDIVVEYCILNGIFDILEINEVLFRLDLQPLGY